MSPVTEILHWVNPSWNETRVLVRVSSQRDTRASGWAQSGRALGDDEGGRRSLMMASHQTRWTGRMGGRDSRLEVTLFGGIVEWKPRKGRLEDVACQQWTDAQGEERHV